MAVPGRRNDAGFVLVLLRTAVLAAAALSIALFVYLAIRRIGYPFELEWMEGAALAHVTRILHGLPLYAPPTLDFVAFIYPPLYFYVAAGAAHLMGPGFPALRLVSLLSALGTLLVLFLLIRQETRSALCGIAAAGLYAAAFRLSSGWYDIGRVDSLFLFLFLLAVYLLRAQDHPIGDVLAGLLLAASFQTKQTALLVSLPVVFVVCLRKRRRAAWLVGAWAIATAGSALWLHFATHGWYTYYVSTLPAHHAFGVGRFLAYAARDLASPFAAAVLLGIFGLMRLRGDPTRRGAALFYALLAAGMLFASALARAHAGGYLNVLMPGFAGLALLFGVGIHAGSTLAADGPARSWPRILTLTAALLQFLSLAYVPTHLLPTRADEAAGRELVRTISSYPGEVWLPAASYLAGLAGKPTHAHELAIYDVLRGDDGPARKELVAEIRRRIAQGEFDAVIVTDDWFLPEIRERYELRGPALPDEDVFWPVSGGHARPTSIYVRKVSGAGSPSR